MKLAEGTFFGSTVGLLSHVPPTQSDTGRKPAFIFIPAPHRAQDKPQPESKSSQMVTGAPDSGDCPGPEPGLTAETSSCETIKTNYRKKEVSYGQIAVGAFRRTNQDQQHVSIHGLH